MWWTQWPTSPVGSGICSERRPLLIGRQDWPPSSVRKLPADETITGRRKDELERVVRDIERKGGQALALQAASLMKPMCRKQ